MAQTDTLIAEAIFRNEPYSWRRKDVRTTEKIARDIQEYNPELNDWPGVDTKGSVAAVSDYEDDGQNEETERSAVATKIGRKYVYFVNWYGKDSSGTDVWSKSGRNSSDLMRTWSYYKWKDGDWTLLTIKSGSKLFRSAWVESFDSPVTGHWYTSRQIAISYNRAHYDNTIRNKQVFPAFVTRSIDLIDMTDEQNVRMILDLAKQTDEYAFDAISKAFRLGAGEAPVYRSSHIDYDSAFCEWFKIYMVKFDGWIFLATSSSGHHDEIFINEPQDVLKRARYLVKEVDKLKWSANIVE